MFSKLFTSGALVLALCLQRVSAHAAVAPALGVNGTPVRNNFRRPNNANPCGAGINIANAIDSSTAVAANAAGSFTATAINFNGGGDGSRQVTARVDATGTGQNFVAATVTTNGNRAPNNVGSEQIVASLPAGTQCTGGQAGNRCLVGAGTAAGGAADGAAAGGAAGTANTGNTGTANNGQNRNGRTR
ncbi:unnamed protein product [Cyclocybe aegerita]|uniref:Uncharacterized protein n=1 Tax=Cyclocybe aegerita TaxID=1973307 RepID=A0A8S0X1P3_CYCAE|nr:unnamed protein product [Cyclocybe aegerita]